jgi:hypothetical protein
MMSLRSAYFDDWKWDKTVLLWGDAVGMNELRDFLRGVGRNSNADSLDGFCKAVDGRTITVKVVKDRSATGMRLVSDRLEWRLQPELAVEFAEKVDVLSSQVGHQYLDSYNHEIAVEVSAGEYSADLHPDRAVSDSGKAQGDMRS